jgi:hypothetical protein
LRFGAGIDSAVGDGGRNELDGIARIITSVVALGTGRSAGIEECGDIAGVVGKQNLAPLVFVVIG